MLDSFIIKDAVYEDIDNKCITFTLEDTDTKKLIPYGFVIGSNDTAPVFLKLKEMWESGKVSPRQYNGPSKEEALSSSVKSARNRILNKTDKYMTLDFPLSDEDKNEIKQFRQQLRDITKQVGFPDKVKWPTPPDCIKDQISMPS